jgi:hypothetical protein
MNIQTLVAKVKEMRQAQKDYFRLAYEAKKDPFKHEERKRVLAESKALEKEVDVMLEKYERGTMNYEGITIKLEPDDKIVNAQMTDDEQVEYKGSMPRMKNPPPPPPPRDRIIIEGADPEKPKRGRT